jgi:hypothetical protein
MDAMRCAKIAVASSFFAAADFCKQTRQRCGVHTCRKCAANIVNKLYVGLSKTIALPKGGLLLINDEVRDVPDWRRPRIFDPLKHSFDPLKGIDYRKAVALVDAIMAVMPGGENTLTKEDAEFILLEALLSKPRSLERLIEKSKDPTREKARRMVGRLLLSPVIKRVLCGKTNFTFNPNSVNMARINRAELGDFDALVLGLLLMGQFKGQLVVADLGFYGRDAHVQYDTRRAADRAASISSTSCQRSCAAAYC